MKILLIKNSNKVLVCLLFCLFTISTNINAQIWTPITGLPTTESFKAVKFINSSVGWVAGENGTIVKTTNGGANWTLQTSNTTQTLRGIFFIDANNGWACGDLGVIIATTDGGNNWVAQTSGITIQLNGVQFVNTTTGWVLTNSNILLKTTNGGSTWLQQIVSGAQFWGIDMQNTNTGYIAGGFNSVQGSPSLLKTTNGSNWAFQNNSGVSSFLGFNDVHFTDANNGWIVGGNGTIRHTADGGSTTWTSQTSGTQLELLSVDFINTNIGYACGRQGVIIATTNGGATWQAQSSSIFSGTLWQLDMIDATTGFAVGDNGLILKYTVYSPPQPIVLFQPNIGAEVFQINTKRFIIWQAQPNIANVKIEYSTTGNTGPFSTIVASTPASSGSYVWTVPNTSSVNCFIRISNAANSATQVINNNAFYILNTAYGLDYSVLTSATAKASPPQITVSWVADVNALSYTLDKKLTTDINWTNLATLSGTTNSYIDNNVSTGIIYEYRVIKVTPLATGYGYLYSGINIAASDFRGTMLLAVDSSFATPLATEITQLKNDLIGDGWKVIQKNFASTTKDTTLKNWIVSQYNTPSSLVKSLLIIGHFAIPYSGNFAPDGHSERVGAQPADVFYADVDGAWTDNTVTTNNSGIIHTPNIPNDSKWDQSVIPSKAELQVGRIDMYNMTGFALSETNLIRQYLNKNHLYRHKIINPRNKALINTHLDNQLFTISAVAWRSFAPMLGSSNIVSINTNGCAGNNTCNTFIDSLESNSYIWSYIGGGGSDTSIADPVFTSSQCINRTINSVFMQLYGSYLVEWAKGGISTLKNNLLRAPLANAGMPLATCWTGGSPRWYFHQMGLGESIGFATLQSQNNTTIYDPGNNTLLGAVSMALMGDPSLRLHTVYPITNLVGTPIVSSNQLNWTASIDNNIIGYNVYRSDTITGTFVKLNSTILNTTAYTDNAVTNAVNSVYMVRAVKLENVTSGSYQNMSEGIFTTVTRVLPIELLSFSAKKMAQYNQLIWTTASERNNARFEIERSSDNIQYEKIANVNAVNHNNNQTYYFNDFDIAKEKVFYRLKQVDNDGKYSYSNIVTIVRNNAKEVSLFVYPNPANKNVIISLSSAENSKYQLMITSMLGQPLYKEEIKFTNGVFNFKIPSTLKAGNYIIQLKNQTNTLFQKIIISY